jgi:uncharacterized protein (TIGR02301 family)
MLRIPLTILALFCALQFASAQETTVAPTVTVAPQVEDVVAPYDEKLLRIAEVLGSIHVLRDICGAKEGNKWRDVMSELIASEEPGAKRKARMIARFNRGFNAFNQTYTNCTPSALTAAERYRLEAIRLSEQISSRYGR